MIRLIILFAIVAGLAAVDDPRCGIVFDPEPRLDGMSFERQRLRPGEIRTGGRAVAAWVAMPGSDPQRGYGRMLRVRVDDARFRDGRMPAVDIELEFQQTQRVGVEVWADTASGLRRVGRAWGGEAGMRTLRCSLDDARFAAADGADLRILSANADLAVRALRVQGYDRREPSWPRLLRSGEVAVGREVLLFAAGEAVTASLPLRNLALVGFSGSWEAVVRRPDGGEAARLRGDLAVPAEGDAMLPLRVSAERPFGVHRIDIAWRDAGGAEVGSRSIAFGVSASTAALPKAAPGSFLYGLDVRNGEIHTQPAYLAWMDAIGTDIVRGGAVLERLHEAMPAFRARGLQVMAMADIRWHEDGRRRAEDTARLAGLAERTAHDNPDLLWWELGNEPDLTGFYAGPVEAYLQQAAVVAAAVRRGNPAARTMNGGLAFHGREGDERARRLLADFAAGGFDGVAYHGHGPGMAAERNALERLRGAMADAGLRPAFVIDTETGVAAVARPAQERVQARTAVQKLVYGQSEGLPMMFWFRLHFEHADAYGNVVGDDPRQPRPVLLALRSLVERLRDLRPSGRLDLGGRDIAAFAFASADGRQRRLVLWSEDGCERTLAFALDADADGAEHHDLFGNPAPALRTGAVTQVDIGPDPVILSWRTRGDAPAPRVVDPPVAIAGDIALAAGRRTMVRAVVGNPTAARIRGTARLVADSALVAATTAVEAPFDIAPGGAARLDVAIDAPPAEAGSPWPTRWTVFTGVDPASADPSRLAAIPASLPAEGGGEAPARMLESDGDVLDFAAVHGSHRERRCAVAMAEIASDAPRTLAILAGADWWMTWAVDGAVVYDTTATGNGGAIDPPAHAVRLPLRQGRNLVAVAVRSGSMGWRLLAAGPERSRLLSGASRERVALEVLVDGTPWAAAVASVRPLARPVRTPSPLAQGDVQTWRGRAGGLRLAEASIVNLWEAHPDRRNWWQGDADLSARIWIAAGPDGLGVVAEVQDDVHRAGDALRVALSGDGVAVDADLRVAEGDGGGFEVRRDPATATTWYRIPLGRPRTGADGLLINVVVEDDDRGERKQYLRLRPGLDGGEARPASWLRLLPE